MKGLNISNLFNTERSDSSDILKNNVESYKQYI